jgi:hypothetical protein
MQRPQFSPRGLEDFLKRQITKRTDGGLPLAIIDFSALDGPPGAGMMVAMIRGEDQTLFVKMSGGKPLLQKNMDAFLKFCQSLSQGG